MKERFAIVGTKKNNHVQEIGAYPYLETAVAVGIKESMNLIKISFFDAKK